LSISVPSYPGGAHEVRGLVEVTIEVFLE
jgi:hypothetical protein